MAFRLFDLPPELRNQIYAHVLTSPEQEPLEAVCRSDYPWTYRSKLKVPQPDLLRVCRKLRAETLPIFYGQNKYLLDDSHITGCLKWLDQIALHVRHLTSVEVRFDSLMTVYCRRLVFEDEWTFEYRGAWTQKGLTPMEAMPIHVQNRWAGVLAGLQGIRRSKPELDQSAIKW